MVETIGLIMIVVGIIIGLLLLIKRINFLERELEVSNRDLGRLANHNYKADRELKEVTGAYNTLLRTIEEEETFCIQDDRWYVAKKVDDIAIERAEEMIKSEPNGVNGVNDGTLVGCQCLTCRERREINKKDMEDNKAVVTDLGDKTKVKRGWRADWKVTPEMKKEIIKSKKTQEQLAKEFGISRSRVGQIKRGGK